MLALHNYHLKGTRPQCAGASRGWQDLCRSPNIKRKKCAQVRARARSRRAAASAIKSYANRIREGFVRTGASAFSAVADAARTRILHPHLHASQPEPASQHQQPATAEQFVCDLLGRCTQTIATRHPVPLVADGRFFRPSGARITFDPARTLIQLYKLQLDAVRLSAAGVGVGACISTTRSTRHFLALAGPSPLCVHANSARQHV